jgi:hypothetical protein
MADLVENLAPLPPPPVVQSPNPTALIVETRPMLERDIWGTRTPIGVAITPVEQQKWTLSAFAIMLNELDSTQDRDGRIRSATKHISADNSRFHLHMLFQCEGTALARWLAVKVLPGDWSLDVKTSREWVVIEWEPLEITRESREATQHRSTRTPCQRRSTQYQWMIKATKDATIH